MAYLVLLRHGESTYNQKNLFTGWTDCPLTEKGEEEAREAASLLKENGFTSFDYVQTSVLERAIRTTEIVLEELKLSSLPIHLDYRFNERHYGALEGYNKALMTEKLGYDKVYAWRRTFKGRPPLLTEDDKRNPRFDAKYQGIDENLLPLGESLEDTYKRVLPAYKDDIVPELKENRNVLLVAHANSLRALVMYLDKSKEEDAPSIYLPTGIPLVYKMDNELKISGKKFLGDEKEVEQKIKESLYRGFHQK